MFEIQEDTRSQWLLFRMVKDLGIHAPNIIGLISRRGKHQNGLTICR